MAFLHYDNEEDGVNGTLGKYVQNSNIIKLFNEKDDIKRHELLHCIFYKKDNSGSIFSKDDNNEPLPIYFDEGMTELLVDEYFSDKPFLEDNSYPYEITAIKIIADMIGSDALLEAYTTRDMNVIYDSFREKLDSSSFIYKLESIIESYENGNSVSQESLDELLKISDSYMKNKYGEDSQNYKAYEYNTKVLKLLSDEKPNEEYVDFILENGSYVKPYFSSELKEEYTTYEPIQYFKSK